MRKKKGKGPAERLSEMKEHFLFRSIDEALPGQLDKLHIVEGDCQVCTLNTVGFIPVGFIPDTVLLKSQLYTG